MLQPKVVHKLIVLLVIALIARPALSATMPYQHSMQDKSVQTVSHCHDSQASHCNMAADDGSAMSMMSCDNCSDSCMSAFDLVSVSEFVQTYSHVHSLEPFPGAVVQRHEEAYRPPIAS